MKNKEANGCGRNSIVFIVFIVLKLTGTIDWSWLWVCSPIWIPLAVLAVGGRYSQYRNDLCSYCCLHLRKVAYAQ